jgi:zinc protease
MEPRQVASVLQGPFRDASDFTFVFVGSFDLATMKPLVERYWALLNPSQRDGKDVGADGNRSYREKVEKGIEPKSLNAIVFSAVRARPNQRIAIRAMSEVLERDC